MKRETILDIVFLVFIIFLFFFIFGIIAPNKEEKIIYIPINEKLVKWKSDGTYVSRPMNIYKESADSLEIDNYLIIEQKINWEDSVKKGYYQDE